MAMQGAYQARAGYERIPGAARRYKDVSTGEELSRRQYIKRTEGVPSLESKAKQLSRARALAGEVQPMKEYNKYVSGFKAAHGKDAHVRGKAFEAQEFQRAMKTMKKKGWRRTKERKEERWHALQVMGMAPADKPMPEGFGES